VRERKRLFSLRNKLAFRFLILAFFERVEWRRRRRRRTTPSPPPPSVFGLALC